jgi:hypothetical protein
MHRSLRVAALVLLEYLAIAAAVYGLLLGAVAPYGSRPQTCGVDSAPAR